MTWQSMMVANVDCRAVARKDGGDDSVDCSALTCKDDEGRCCVTLTCKDENATEFELAVRKLNSNQDWNHHW